MMHLPSPPGLKATIIQLNKDLDQDNGNFEVLTNYNDDVNLTVTMNESSEAHDQVSPIVSSKGAKKKRRRSSSNVPKEELDKRRFETKQLHSIIEKRRRIKINREFEALKYLIPACRTSSSNQTPNMSPKLSMNNNSNNSNSSKIDGMYKLTILKSSVEYILYLHNIIQKQLEMISSYNPNFDYDLSFAKVPLNVNHYRNIDKEFNFKSLLPETDATNDKKTISNDVKDIKDGSDSDNDNNNDNDDFQLPSPIITPHMGPTKFKYNSKFQLPDPAVSLPRKKTFKALPESIIINDTKYSSNTNTTNLDLELGLEDTDNERANASKTLLSLRKSSIESLLN